jgi:hypothetical protein
VKHPERIAYRRLFVSRCGFVARICQISPDVQSKLDFNRAFQTSFKWTPSLSPAMALADQLAGLCDAALRNRGSLTVWFRDILRSREDVRREYQVKIAVNALDRVLERGCPNCVRVA